MKQRTFEDFLKNMHANLFPMLLDDEGPDHFDNWLGTLDGADYIEWGTLYGREQFLAGQAKVLENK